MKTRYQSEIESLLGDPAASYWLKTALCSALARDPIDAERDAGLLFLLLRSRAEQALGSADALCNEGNRGHHPH